MMAIKATYYNTMVTWENIVFSDLKMLKKVTFPVYEEILLDGFKSLIDNEYNKVLLFSTIAIESLLSHTYDKIYEKEMAKKQPSKKFRILQNSSSSSKDPIWKALMDRTDFKKLLHEAPLYLLNRSILLDNESLYKDLIKLYNTRNKIVHWGAPISHDPDKLITLDERGAYKALKMAIGIFNWLGIAKYDVIVETGFIELKKNEVRQL